ncbi:hypothetical protein VaNZ11_004837 [Volvox africanus]|uniref:FAM91 N-terminal domain-containing protein n=1 Tax=Volvox africanus TaxID=51714 RepID=A0ABQ5RYV5_9CHLO|nr:hypothetical protein VaNZ11_004837 [Volvox africanus]
MASLEIVKRAIAGGRVYDDLPPRIKNMITPNEWKTRVKEHCIQRGLPWATSLACTVMGQQEYYDELLRCYKSWMRLFPYHLSDYLCRVARITPFKYYLDMMTSVLKDERSYDRVPNFTAADALSVLGIGRNEYISALNACKARRLLWRVNLNRDSIVREQLPQEPTINTRLEPWWRVAVVNIGEAEYRELDEEELAHLKTAAVPVTAAGGDIRVRDFQLDVLRGLLRKGLAYIEVPVERYDRFAIPPLEGFVSNKTTEVGDAAADPFESLLYSVFVANSERMTVAELGQILGVNLEELKAAIGVASRLGFATRVTDSYTLPSTGTPISGAMEGDAGIGSGGGSQLYGRVSVGVTGNGGDEAALQQQRSLQLGEGLLEPAGRESKGALSGGVGGTGGGGIAVVMDAEATGYLMMGALSPGLKRHSVTLFEGGRVAGEEVMQEMVSELWSSYAAGQGFEGEMLRLTHYAAALATLLEAVRASAGPGVPLELLRKESLAGLSPMAVSKVLNHAYCAVVPISPLPPPVLPLSPLQPGPAYYGPTLEAVSPWLHLALYSAARCGPASYVFVCGQRVWRLPHPLDRCTHALLTPWDEDTEPGKGGKSHGTEGQMMLVESSFLLYTLNELLSRTAVLVQPLDCTEPEWCPDVVDVPLPLPLPIAEPGATTAAAAAAGGSDRLTVLRISSTGISSASTIASPTVVSGIRRTNGEAVRVVLEPGVVSGLQQLGLASCIGHLRLIRMRAHSPATATEEQPHPPASPAGPSDGSVVGGPRGAISSGSQEGGGAPQGQHHQWQGDGVPAAAGGGGGGGTFRTGGSITITAASQSRNHDAAAALAGTQGSGGPYASVHQPLMDGPSIPTSLPSPRPPVAPGGGGRGCGSDFDATAAAAAAGEGRGGVSWLPLSVQLGVPLYCLDLCRAVCRAAQAAGFLTPEGRQTHLQAHKVLQVQLTKLLVQYSHCGQDGSYGSATGLVAAAAAAAGEAAALTSDIRAASTVGSSTGRDSGGGGGGSGGDFSSRIGPGGSLGRMNPVLPLPALNLSFDGHSLQPIRLRDSVQGLGCLCQG